MAVPPVRERAFVAQPAVAAGGKVITSPFQFYADGTENLRLRIWSSIATTVGLSGRWLRTNNEVHQFRHDFSTTTDRLPVEFNIPIDAGYMLSCSLGIFGSTVTRIGQVFVQLALVRGRGDAALECGTILQGYVATSHWIAFPGSPIMHSLEGPGFKHLELPANPLAGNDFRVPVPEHAMWRIYYVYAVFVTSAVAGNRFPQFGINSGVATVLNRVQAPQVVGAGAGFNFFWSPNIPFGPAATAIANCVQIPMPEPYYALQLHEVRSDTVGILGGDQWSTVRLLVEEWLDTDVFGAPL